MVYSYESLLAEFEEKLDISEERDMFCEGLYADGCIWIKRELPGDKKVSILAEEIGHHETTVGDILDQRKIDNQKQELKARKWAYNKLAPFEAVLDAAAAGCRRVYEFAEYFGVDEQFMVDCLKCYGLL